MQVVQLLLSHLILKRCGGQSCLVAQVGLCRLVIAEADDRMRQALRDLQDDLVTVNDGFLFSETAVVAGVRPEPVWLLAVAGDKTAVAMVELQNDLATITGDTLQRGTLALHV